MADELGTARLTIEVDDQDARNKLRSLRQAIQDAGKASVTPVSLRDTPSSRQRGSGSQSFSNRQSDLTQFLRDLRLREDGEKRAAQIRSLGAKDALALEKALVGQVQRRVKIEQTAAASQARQRARIRGLQAGGKEAVNILGSTAIGAGFPLLFGQGIGAAGGGGIGGLLGASLGGAGGFAGSILGTAVGSLGDQFTELARAVESPVENLDKLIEASALSGRGVENLAKALTELGLTSEAEALLRQDLSRRISPQTFLSVAAASDAYGRSIAEVTQNIGALLAGPAASFAAWLAEIINRVANLPEGGLGPTRTSAEGLRRRGVGLQVIGTQVAGLGLGITAASGGALAKPGLALAAGGAGLSALGGALGGGADFQREQIEAAKRTAPILAQITEIEQRRIDIQRDLVQANLTGNKAKENELRLEDTLLRFEKEKAQARAVLESSPTGEGADINQQVQSFKAQTDAINLQKQAAIDLFQRDQQLRRANIQLNEQQTSIALSGINQQIQAARQLGAVEGDVAKKALALRQDVEQSIGDAARKVASIQVGIDTARRVGDTDKVRDLTLEQQLAAKQTELALENGANALRDAGKQLLEDAKSTARSLQGLREDNLQFQTPQEQARTLAELRRQVQAEATRRGVNVSFQGTPEEQRRQMRGFVSFGEEERRLVQQGEQISLALRTATQPLLDSNTTLGGNLTELSGAVSSLVQKDWNIVVNVQGGSGFDVEGASRGLS